MFSTEDRHVLLRSTLQSEGREKKIRAFDAAYAPLLMRFGLNSAGQPPTGPQFVSRATPAGTALCGYTGTTATAAVWCNTLFGLTGRTAPTEIPVEDGWLTMTLHMRWQNEKWRMTTSEQTEGPEPGTKAARDFAPARPHALSTAGARRVTPPGLGAR